MNWRPTGLVDDLRKVRGKSVAGWYGDVVVAWDSLPKEATTERASRWRNLGYWTAQTQTYDEAARDLAIRLADAAGVAPGLDVLDVGCGSGASTYLLSDRLRAQEGPATRVAGLDLTPGHIAHAVARGGDSPPEFHLGSAVDMPFPNASFDRVLALECAFHFPSRPRFFAEAYRVLREGGVLAVADVLVTPRFQRLMRAGEQLPGTAGTRRLAADILKMPTANLVDLPTYQRQLSEAGFRVARTEDITEHVFPYFMKYWRQSRNPAREVEMLQATGLSEQEARTWARAWARQMSVLMLGWRTSRYVVLTAERQAGPSNRTQAP